MPGCSSWEPSRPIPVPGQWSPACGPGSSQMPCGPSAGAAQGVVRIRTHPGLAAVEAVFILCGTQPRENSGGHSSLCRVPELPSLGRDERPCGECPALRSAQHCVSVTGGPPVLRGRSSHVWPLPLPWGLLRSSRTFSLPDTVLQPLFRLAEQRRDGAFEWLSCHGRCV